VEYPGQDQHDAGEGDEPYGDATALAIDHESLLEMHTVEYVLLAA
jgi:hypothetical protein